MQKVGGGYIFIHRMLLEHFAGVALLPTKPSKAFTDERLTDEFEFETVTINGQVKRRREKAEYTREVLGGGCVLDLVRIPGGRFLMGSPEGKGEASEKPQHQVSIKSFWIGQVPVTQAQWQAVANLPRFQHKLKLNPSRFKCDSHPVENVSWHDAMEFCARLSKKTGRDYRLPSEAEWEYACRAGTTSLFYFGETITPEFANYNSNFTYGSSAMGQYREQTTDVGGFPANAFGLYDMHGNVWEWCLDCWNNNYINAPVDGSAWVEESWITWITRCISLWTPPLCVLRGGSWNYDPKYCRSAFRYRGDLRIRMSNTGFRIVCSLE